MSTVLPDTGNVMSGLRDVLNALQRKTPGQPVDWGQVLAMYGLPRDVAARVNTIFQSSGTLEQAIPIAQAFVRGTPWYTKTFPGIQAGINSGLFSDEQGYRVYKSRLDQLYKQYYNRPATTSEVGRFATSGQDLSRVAAGLQSQAIAGNVSDPLRSLFTKAEIQAFANQQAGIDSRLGQRISAEADMATRVNSLYQDFFGRPVSRTELSTLTRQGLSPEQVARNFATDANVAAMNPAISSLFTPNEVRELAIERAGGITAHGQALEAQAGLASQLNPIFHQYTGAGVSRNEVVNAYKTGETVESIRAGLAGKAFTDARGQDIQQTLGAFGGGQLNPEQLAAFGRQAVGYDNPLGQQMQVAFEKAQRRMNRVFGSVLGRASSALPYTRPSDTRRPDVAA